MALYIGDTLIAGNIDGQQLNNPFSLLDYKYSEYELSNASWLLSNGQWNSGAIYQSVYNLLLQIYNGTVTKAGVSVKLSSETYADTDFVLNTGDTTFRLPIKVLMAGSKRVAGNGKTLGLTNGTSNNGSIYAAGLANSANIARLSGSGAGTDAGSTYSYTAFTDGVAIGVSTDPLKSGIETSTNGLYLYFYVGEVVQDANIIAAGQALTDIADLKAHYIVETYVNGTSWYKLYSDGWCEQGGYVTSIPPSATGLQVIFLKEFIDTNYYSSPNASSSVNYVGTCCHTFTTTSMYVTNRTNDTINCKWEAKGYIS